MPKEIPLANGKGIAIVDDDDFAHLSQWSWYLHPKGYAMRGDRSTGKFVTIFMHRVIMDAPTGLQVDHINCDGLDNRRSNLRLATNTENGRNRDAYSNSASGFKGVSWEARDGKWRAYIRVDGHGIHIGYFDDKVEAAHAYDRTAKEHHGAFARLNFP